MYSWRRVCTQLGAVTLEDTIETSGGGEKVGGYRGYRPTGCRALRPWEVRSGSKQSNRRIGNHAFALSIVFAG